MEKRKKSLIVNSGITLTFLVILFLAWTLKDIILPFFLALLLAYILQPFVALLQKKGFSVIISVIIIYVLFILIIYLIGFFALPELMEDASLFLQSVPDLLEDIQSRWQKISSTMDNFPLPELITESLDNFLAQWDKNISMMVEGMATSFFEYIRYFISLLLAPFLSYYMLRDKEAIKKKVIAWLPPKERPEILRIAGDINHLLRQFLYGYLLVSVIVAVLTALALALVGVRYFLFLGLLMGISDLIPYFGPFLGAIPILIVALSESKNLALYALIVVLLVQQLEGSVISPKIVGDRIGLHPLTVIFVVMAGGFWFGILGMILAVPVSAALKLMIAFIYSRAVAWKES
ncbi:MAG: AI-2E family transporter [Clostridiales bacterium]